MPVRFRSPLETDLHTTLRTRTIPTTSGNQSSLEQSDSTQPTVDPELHQHLALSIDQTPTTLGVQSSFQQDDSTGTIVKTEIDEHTELSIDLIPTNSGNQSSLEQSGDTQPTVSRETNEDTSQTHLDAQRNNQRRRESYSDHPILKLEGFVGRLNGQEAMVAAAFFTLIRVDHHRSDDHVEELKELFAPMRQQLDRDRAVLEQKLAAFDEAESDVLKYEALVGELDDANAKVARALLDLCGSHFKDRLEFAGLLIEPFSPLKQRKMHELSITLTHRHVFE